MPRKRRAAKRRRLPEGLSDISLTERICWRSSGPLLESDVAPGSAPPPGYVAWPSLSVWAAFYGTVRDELYIDRPWLRERSCGEAVFAAWQAGETDLEAVRDGWVRRRPDPRFRLMGGR